METHLSCQFTLVFLGSLPFNHPVACDPRLWWEMHEVSISVHASPWKRNHAGPKKLSQRRGVLSDDNQKWAFFLFNLFSQCYICIVKYLLTIRDVACWSSLLSFGRTGIARAKCKSRSCDLARVFLRVRDLLGCWPVKIVMVIRAHLTGNQYLLGPVF